MSEPNQSAVDAICREILRIDGAGHHNRARRGRLGARRVEARARVPPVWSPGGRLRLPHPAARPTLPHPRPELLTRAPGPSGPGPATLPIAARVELLADALAA